MKMCEYQQIWIKSYKEKYLKKYNKLISLYDNNTTVVNKLYIELYNIIIEIFKNMYLDNCVIFIDKNLIIKEIIRNKISKDGYAFYDLCNAIQKCIKQSKVLPQKYFTEKYLNEFKTINKFLEQRTTYEVTRYDI